ncbi:hypothetical protein JRO89_XS06G0096700 [Xanthoceras sorbifolium]|uniref:non-specific serine/threonine protein kinase n=1 Tax=Xanthoceras sorbifolium TaxID=99658 RepID=A0ABQ8HXH9_9ROSI|nr:hypothetical protein JRO89_XS06G0096700 [Xanthoceras sorbifolium]
MELISRNCRISVVALVVLLSCFFLDFGNATDTITSLQFIRDPETIVSSAGTFKMGFFSPGNSTNRYVGVWYTDVSPTTVVWVANCNKPLNDSSGVLTISEDGNLVVLNGQKEVLWSSNVSNSATNSTFAQLLDSGNLVLSDKTKEISIWESFLYPTDTSLPGMRLSTNLRTGDKLQLTSWKSPSDPSTGRFSTGIDPLNIPEIFIWKDNRPYWRTGPWNGRIFLGMRNVFSTVYLDGFNLVVDNQEDIAYFDFGNSSRFYVMTSDGILQERDPVLGTEFPEIFWAPKIECDIYGTCGPFGICNSITNPICSCLRGFEPKNEEEWNMKNWTSGCVRRRPLQCESINKTGEVGKEDGFLKLETTKLPDFAERSTTPVDKCREQCLNNCSCMAYTFDVGIGCMTWSSNLTDLQKFPKGGADLYIRLANPELDFLRMDDECSGYMSPEYAMVGRFSEKSDVFSFGLETVDYFSIDFGNTITSLQFIRDPETIVSNGANRNKPLNDSSGVLTISEDGNLVVLNGQKEVLWSSNVSNSATNSTVAQLSDSAYGRLTSWKSPSDPSTGRFSTGIDPLNIPQIFIWEDNRPYWRTGPWNGRIFLGMRNVWSTVYLDGFNLVVDNQEDIAYFDFGNSSRFYVMTSDGILQERDPVLGTEFAEIFWAPKIECDIYGTCGPFGICNSITNPICSCLRGFEPKNEEEWNMRNWTSGCVRRRPLQCESVNKTGEVGKEDGFLKLETTKLPDFAERSTTPVDKCREQCLNNCSCMAYTFDVGIGCMTWSGNLTDLQKFPKGGADLYIRLANPELGKLNALLLDSLTTTLCLCFCFYYIEN